MDTKETKKMLENGVYSALETYSNVHRGSGYNSYITTHLFDKARDLVLEYLNLNKRSYTVIFCTERRANAIINNLDGADYIKISSNEYGLSLGLYVLAVKKKKLVSKQPTETGGGTANLISTSWVLWAGHHEKFEAGTPPVINIIYFVLALIISKKHGVPDFKEILKNNITVDEIFEDEFIKHNSERLFSELRKHFIGLNKEVPTTETEKSFINFDNAASTPTLNPVWNTFKSSVSLDKKVQEKVTDKVRSVCAGFLNAPLDTYNIEFTSNTTEAINIIALNFANPIEKNKGCVVFSSFSEHSSNDLPWRMVNDGELQRINFNSDGFVNIEELESGLKKYCESEGTGTKKTKIVALCGASNVLGVCNDLEEISKVVHKYDALLLVDAAQLVAHRKIDMKKTGIDLLAFSGHKIYAPFGTGVLVARKGILKYNSDEMQLIINSGEENIAGIAALGKSLDLLNRTGMEVIEKEEAKLTKKLIEGMKQIPGIKISGINETDHPKFKDKLGVVVFELKGLMANQIAKKLSSQGGIGVRYGCHCAHITVKKILNVSPGLEKFQKVMISLLPSMQLPGITRVSLGLENTAEEIDRFLIELRKIANKAVKNQKPNNKVSYSSQLKNSKSNSVNKVFAY